MADIPNSDGQESPSYTRSKIVVDSNNKPNREGAQNEASKEGKYSLATPRIESFQSSERVGTILNFE